MTPTVGIVRRTTWTGRKLYFALNPLWISPFAFRPQPPPPQLLASSFSSSTSSPSTVGHKCHRKTFANVSGADVMLNFWSPSLPACLPACSLPDLLCCMCLGVCAWQQTNISGTRQSFNVSFNRNSSVGASEQSHEGTSSARNWEERKIPRSNGMWIGPEY